MNDIIIITGGTSGLGLELVKKSIEKGFMVCNIERYYYDKSEFLSKLINNGKKHLAELIDYFDLSDEKDIEEK